MNKFVEKNIEICQLRFRKDNSLQDAPLAMTKRSKEVS